MEPLRHIEIPEIVAATPEEINDRIRLLNTQLDELVRRVRFLETQPLAPS